ncbi:MAG: nucleotidyltransferase domain-containing protein [Candidatus Pacebacteria bacterium]|nr:nucleotidyltransferase domain-containing protein [Candidatus Paceibacterota bacterium]
MMDATGAIVMKPHELEIVQTILARHLPRSEVWVYGSRALGDGVKPFSDLDLCIKAESPLPLSVIADLRDEFTECDLPYKVDMSDWHRLSESFKLRIEPEMVRLKYFKVL